MMRIALLLAVAFVVMPHVYEALHRPQSFGDHYLSGKLRMLREARRAADGELVNDGAYTSYYESGRQELAGQYADGVRVGEWRWWYESGRPKAACRYENGKGDYTAWYESGKVLQNGHYDGARRTGAWTEFFESGQKAIVGEYVHDRQHGWWTYWREGESEPATRIRWDQGRRVEG